MNEVGDIRVTRSIYRPVPCEVCEAPSTARLRIPSSPARMMSAETTPSGWTIVGFACDHHQRDVARKLTLADQGRVVKDHAPSILHEWFDLRPTEIPIGAKLLKLHVHRTRLGDHDHCQIFAGFGGEGSLAKAGNIILRATETTAWKAGHAEVEFFDVIPES